MMNILGINGLGVSPAACIVQDGKLIAMAEEERFNRIKVSYGMMPDKAVRFCLDYANLSLEEIDCIVFPWDAFKYRFYMPYFMLLSYLKNFNKVTGGASLTALEELLKYQPQRIKSSIFAMLRRAGIRGRVPKIRFVPHHLAHAASSFYCSGSESAYVLVIDGSGEDKCTTVYKGEGLKLKEIKSFRIPDSLGWFYQSITEFLGFIPNRHEGKTMALAAYGSYNEEIFNKIRRMVSYGKNGSYRYDASYSFFGVHGRLNICSEKMIELLQHYRYYTQALRQKHEDIAFAAQKTLEDIACSLVRNLLFRGKKNICIAGGVGLNCKMNGKLMLDNCVDGIFVPPFCNDAGTALGAALVVATKNGFDPRFKLEHSYWGPEFSNENIKAALDSYGIKYEYKDDIAKATAGLLAQDRIVGWFQGRMEIGARAMGARSILANPMKKGINEMLNAKVKRRELWRPFAPSLLYEHRDRYCVNLRESPFMALTCAVTEHAKEKIPAVIHVDGTTRPHLVKKEVNPKYWRLLNEFFRLTGEAVLLNTSFNSGEEPIVCTPADALKTFFSTGLEFIAMGDFLVSKQ